MDYIQPHNPYRDGSEAMIVYAHNSVISLELGVPSSPNRFVGAANLMSGLTAPLYNPFGLVQTYCFLRMLYVLTHKAEKQLSNCSDSHRFGPLSCEKFKLSTTTCSECRASSTRLEILLC